MFESKKVRLNYVIIFIRMGGIYMNSNHDKDSKDKISHAPGKGTDKHHPETPDDADERFRKDMNKNKIQENSKNKKQ